LPASRPHLRTNRRGESSQPADSGSKIRTNDQNWLFAWNIHFSLLLLVRFVDLGQNRRVNDWTVAVQSDSATPPGPIPRRDSTSPRLHLGEPRGQVIGAVAVTVTAEIALRAQNCEQDADIALCLRHGVVDALTTHCQHRDIRIGWRAYRSAVVKDLYNRVSMASISNPLMY
jgi:hypothetical protein